MKDRIVIDGVLYQKVLNESLLKPYTKYNDKLSDGSTPLVGKFKGKNWSAELILQPMTGTPGADEIDLTINAEGEISEYQLQSYDLNDLNDTMNNISRILSRHPDLDTVIDIPDRFDMEDITDIDDIFGL